MPSPQLSRLEIPKKCETIKMFSRWKLIRVQVVASLIRRQSPLESNQTLMKS